MKRLTSFSRAWLLLTACAVSGFSNAQDCVSQLTIFLENIKGGYYVGQTVTLISQVDKKEYKTVSGAKGGAVFTNLPCEQRFDLKVTNYTAAEVVESPRSGARAEEFLVYEPDMAEKDKVFAMNNAEKAALEKIAATLKDTTFVTGSKMLPPPAAVNFICITISLSDLTGKPLGAEQVVMTGKTRKKSVKGTTGPDGKLMLYLLKGDSYELHFKYKRSYYQYEVGFTNGSATGSISLSYMGTVEFLRRKKAEEERIKREEERLIAERKRLEEEAKARKLSLEAEIKREMIERAKREEERVIAERKRLEEEKKPKKPGAAVEPKPTRSPGLYTNAGSIVVTKVLDRNKWSEKLIVCDLTGSMMPYASQLSVWYQLNVAKEKNLQFVFFNDGDHKSTSEKKIGSTGGIYYQAGKGMDSLIAIMSLVQSRGGGGDCPENNMEALIKGTKMAKPYKELVMIADNNAPVKDISLLSKFNAPVHIIVCGSVGEIHPDYLLIAWKTKGTVHTMEEDIVKLAAMSEGQSITIGGITYKIMGGEFVKITKA